MFYHLKSRNYIRVMNICTNNNAMRNHVNNYNIRNTIYLRSYAPSKIRIKSTIHFTDHTYLTLGSLRFKSIFTCYLSIFSLKMKQPVNILNCTT